MKRVTSRRSEMEGGDGKKGRGKMEKWMREKETQVRDSRAMRSASKMQ